MNRRVIGMADASHTPPDLLRTAAEHRRKVQWKSSRQFPLSVHPRDEGIDAERHFLAL
jgi:hypothetical protein